MSMINLTWHRIHQVNAGTGMRPEYKHVERPVIVCASIKGVYERDSSQAVHYLETGFNQCPACGNAGARPVWTDDVELWERHPQRCNVAYQP